MKQPSKQWRERIAPDEAAHLVRVAKVIGDLQQARSKKYGQGRALHRKQLLAATGTLEVLDGLPDHARHGLFARPGQHRALVRLSNGGPDIQADRVPDIRGFALKVLNVSGESALGGTTDHQDFLMINQDRAPGANSREFIDFIEAATPGPLSGILHLFKAYGLGGGLSRVRDLFGMLNKKFDGFAAERFNTVAPLCCGPYAVRVRLAPAGNPPPATRAKDIVADMRERLPIGGLTYNLELQFFVDEATTPIEDSSVAWPDAETPVVIAARLVLPRQGVDAAAAEAEAARFDPWSGLAAHRPLGEVMRARKAAYFESQKGRNAA
ncbi:catalase [Reyranella soli]|uniref:Catalase n=1 Tax=Reyranella soli TaxID=1230389 RepID=A0A512NIR9_9HYPH|nr:catalase [Reyranella soli]GEP58812.1 catalase [Reyranella soli]